MQRCPSEMWSGRFLHGGSSAADRHVPVRELVQPDYGKPACLLIRLFKTHPFRDLEPDDQESARALLEDPSINPLTPCLTLLASAGLRPEWNDRRSARGYRAIPMAGKQFHTRFPLSSKLLDKIGVAMSPDPTLDATACGTGPRSPIFLESNAGDSPFVRAEIGFLPSFPVRTVLGLGGHLPSRSVFAAMLFSTVPIGEVQAARFTTIALSIKLAILPFDGRRFFASSADPSARTTYEHERHCH